MDRNLGIGIEAAFSPVNMATAANNGDWVSLKRYRKCVAVLFKGTGTAGEDPVFTLRQAKDVSGTDAKALTFDTIFKKVGTLASIAQFTRATQAAAGTHTDDTAAEADAIMAVVITDDMLDVANGFDCVQLQIPDVGTNAQLGCGFYLLLEPRDELQIPVDSKVN